jgi:CRISPR-associated protein Cmr3
MKILKIKPYDPLALSRSPISPPDTIGIHEILSAPSPTTIAGLLGYLLGVRYSKDDGFWGLKKLLEGIIETGKCGEPIIKGPVISFTEIQNRFYVPMIDKLVSIDSIKSLKNIFGEYVFYIDRSSEREGSYATIRIRKLTRLGVKLRRGYGDLEKVIDLGFMYRYHLTSYSIGEKIFKPTYNYFVNCDLRDLETVVRVGGESRLAKIIIRDDPKLEDISRKIHSPKEVGNSYYIAITPIPLIPKKETIPEDLGKEIIGLEFIEEILGIPEEVKKNKDLRDLERGEKLPKKKIMYLSLGYSEALNMRRPQILALPQGTVIRTRKIGDRTTELMNILWQIGFASLLNLT